jgi:tetratricopeptide (TPR) repeat protein
MWDFLTGEAVPFMSAAVRGHGREAMADGGCRAVPDDRESAGRRLLQLVAGSGGAGPDVSRLVARLTEDPDSQPLLADLTACVDEIFGSDPGKAAQAAAVIAGFYRGQAAAGRVEALVDLGDLFYWDDPQAARAAYQEAVDAGHLPALLGLAKVLDAVIGDQDAAVAVYQQAIGSGDPDVAAEAMYELALQTRHQDEGGARALLEQVIATGHPEWGAAAMVGLAGLKDGDPAAVEALYRRAMATGDEEWSGHAAMALARLLKRRGDTAGATAALRSLTGTGSTAWANHAALDLGELLADTRDVAGAKAVWQPLIDAANPEWATAAFLKLVNVLRGEEDAAGLRAAYQAAVALENPEALYALDQLGHLLHDQGDTDGAHAVWQEAIDAGYQNAEDLREQMMPEPEKRRQLRAYPEHLPPEFNPANMLRAGIEVLECGLPALPETLTYQMAIPVSYWKAEQYAVVLVLRYTRPWRSRPHPTQLMVVYSRASDGTWTPPSGAGGTGFPYDPIARPGGAMHALGGRPMVTGGRSYTREAAPGRPATIATGLAAPEIKHLAVIQDGSEDRRPLKSHFGAWVVCTEKTGEFAIAGLDQEGNVVDNIRQAVRPQDW